MSFADPQSVTIAGTAVSLPRISSGPSSSVYQSADGNTRLTVSHANGKRFRRTFRLQHQKIAGDPLVPATNTQFSMTAYAVVDVPRVGYSVAQQKEVVDALTGYMTATAGASVTKLLGGEN